MEIISQHRLFGGTQYFCKHESDTTRSTMKFSVYVPQAGSAPLPVVYCLAGLTCSEETFAVKAGAQRHAARLGMILVFPDTSPPKLGLPGEADDWDFGLGAGFYVDAMQEPWSRHYRMFSYLTEELPGVMKGAFPQADSLRQSVMGHSMGGHGALLCALKRPDKYASVSAFAPIASATRCPWGRKALTNFMGQDGRDWPAWDVSELIGQSAYTGKILVDQGTEDKFLEQQLKPELLADAARAAGKNFLLRMQPGYDHSYYFISSFIEDHMEFHATELGCLKI